MIEEMTLFATNILLVAHYPINPGVASPPPHVPSEYAPCCNSDSIIIYLSEKFKLHLVIE